MNAPQIRVERADDHAAIFEVHRAAFETDAEACLVDALRDDGSIVLSLIAEIGGEVVGSVIYSRLLFDGAEQGATALAPVAIKPAWQRRGVGSALIREAHARLRNAGERIVLVLGDPEYYERFGFSRAAASRLRTPYDGPHLMALALASGGTSGEVSVTYPPAFAKLG